MKHSSAYEETDEFDAESCRTAQTFNSFMRESLLLDLTEMRIPVYHSIVRSSVFIMENARMTMEFDIFDFVRWSFLFCASQCFCFPFFSMLARIFHGMSYGFCSRLLAFSLDLEQLLISLIRLPKIRN